MTCREHEIIACGRSGMTRAGVLPLQHAHYMTYVQPNGMIRQKSDIPAISAGVGAPGEPALLLRFQGVAAHLPDKTADAVELDLPAQTLKELDADVMAV